MIRLAILALAGLKNVIQFILIQLIGRPLWACARGAYRLVAVPLYKRYVPVKFHIRKKTSASKNWFYPLMSRSALHAIIGIMTFTVVAQSVMARNITQDQFGRKSILNALVLSEGSDESADIVETADTATTHRPTAYLGRGGVVTASSAAAANQPEEIADATATPDGTLASQAAAGGAERQTIENYTVQGGDTISTIAEQFGVSTNTILWANSLNDTSVIRPGDTLQIPPVSGVMHQVKSGDTVQGIANKYKADAQTIMDFNQLATPDAIEPGDILIVPGGVIEQAPAAPTPQKSYSIIDRIFRGPIPPPAPVTSGKRFLWPTPSHKINQYFSWRHSGVDIEGTYSSPIYAASDGTVQSVIYQRFGYGYHVIINHGGSVQTLYGHASKIFVKPGQRVSRGQTIAIVGSTGRSTGTHLHFEIIVNGRKTNPLSSL